MSSAAAEEVLLSLPRDFDVRPVGGWGKGPDGQVRRISRSDLEREAGLFRFRGEEVTQSIQHDVHELKMSCPHCVDDDSPPAA